MYFIKMLFILGLLFNIDYKTDRYLENNSLSFYLF